MAAARSHMWSDPILSPLQCTWIEDKLLQGLNTWKVQTTIDFLQTFTEAAARVLAAKTYHSVLCTLNADEIHDIQRERGIRETVAGASVSGVCAAKPRRGVVINPGPRCQIKVSDLEARESVAESSVCESTSSNSEGDAMGTEGPAEEQSALLPSDASQWVVIPLVEPDELAEQEAGERVEEMS